jgi:hypothetical protein
MKNLTENFPDFEISGILWTAGGDAKENLSVASVGGVIGVAGSGVLKSRTSRVVSAMMGSLASICKNKITIVKYNFEVEDESGCVGNDGIAGLNL